MMAHCPNVGTVGITKGIELIKFEASPVKSKLFRVPSLPEGDWSTTVARAVLSSLQAA